MELLTHIKDKINKNKLYKKKTNFNYNIYNSDNWEINCECGNTYIMNLSKDIVKKNISVDEDYGTYKTWWESKCPKCKKIHTAYQKIIFCYPK